MNQKKKLNPLRLLLSGVTMSFVGIALLFGSMVSINEVMFGLTLSWGVVFSLWGLSFSIISLFRMRTPEKLVVLERKDKAVAWVIVVGLVSLFTFSLLWYALIPPVLTMYLEMRSYYPLPLRFTTPLDMMETVIINLPALVFFMVLLWMFMASRNPEVRDYRL